MDRGQTGWGRYTSLVPPLVRLKDVSVTLAGSPVLQDLTWALQTGEVWAVTGHNGAGKSTFLRLVRGDVWPGGGTRTFALDGRETRSPLTAKARISFVSPEQADGYARAEWALSGWQVVLSGAGGGLLPPYPISAAHEKAAREAAVRVGVEHLLSRDVRALSQGQRRQVLLARALAGRPSALILDEFWEGVDEGAKARLRGVVDDLAREGTTLLYSTHRREEFLAGTTHHLQLAGGRIARQGELGSEPAARQRAVNLFPAKLSGNRAPVTVSIEGADLYRGEHLALRGVNWQLRAGEHWAVLGPNGAGKSSLALLLAGEVHPALGGRVRRLDLPDGASLARRRAAISLVSAETQAGLLRSAALRAQVTGETVIASGFFGTVAGAEPPSAEQRSRLKAVATRLAILDLLPRLLAALSHGQVKKLLLARAIVSAPRLLVLDEPFDSLDAKFRDKLLDLLADLTAGGTQTVFVVHHLSDLPPWVTHGLCLRDGQAIYQGTLTELPREAWAAGSS